MLGSEKGKDVDHGSSSIVIWSLAFGL
jgi:hypothetical protein